MSETGEQRFAALWRCARGYADYCTGNEQCRVHDDAANAIQWVMTRITDLETALAASRVDADRHRRDSNMFEEGWQRDANKLLKKVSETEEKLRDTAQALTECRARERDTWERAKQLEQVEVPGLRVRLRDAEREIKTLSEHTGRLATRRRWAQAEQRAEQLERDNAHVRDMCRQAEQRVAGLEAELRQVLADCEIGWRSALRINETLKALAPPPVAPAGHRSNCASVILSWKPCDCRPVAPAACTCDLMDPSPLKDPAQCPVHRRPVAPSGGPASE